MRERQTDRQTQTDRKRQADGFTHKYTYTKIRGVSEREP